MKKVLILVARLNRYREDFYELLREQLLESNIELHIMHGKSENLKKDEFELSWATPIQHKHVKAGPVTFVWQPVLQRLNEMDMIIVQQANLLLLNYYLILFRKFHHIKMGYWGHGINRQFDDGSFANKFKKMIIRYTDWWFCYTPGVKDLIVRHGFNPDRATVLYNAIDTHKLAEGYQDLNCEDTWSKVRNELNLKSEHIGIYCGGIYKEKRIEFLIEAADMVRSRLEDFELIVIGAGPDAPLLKQLAAVRPWVSYIGPKFGADRIPYFKVASIFLMPGLVGLAILDSFAMETPMVTTNFPYHSPEIEYLENGINGVLTENSVDAYAAEVVDLFENPQKLQRLVEGCRESSTRYTVHRMVKNFKEGIEGCLKL